jgi:protein TonB
LPQPARSRFAFLPERLRARFKERAFALTLTLLVEGLVVFALLTLGPSIVVRQQEASMSVFTLDAPPAPEPSNEPQAEEAAPAEQPQENLPVPPEEPPPPIPEPPQPVQAPPAPKAPAIIQIPADQMAAVDLSAMRSARPAPPRPQAMGPADSSGARDSALVDGRGPNGEPLYAASWYREPYAEELRGYLSTANGPGWGMIACRTVADYRVDSCVAVDEYPAGSNITRAVLAAAWQFRVRPPRVGGQVKVGEWVRIRIDYQLRRQASN